MRHNTNNILCENDAQHDVARKEKKKNVFTKKNKKSKKNRGKLKAVQYLSGDPFFFFSAEVFLLISLTLAAPLTLAKTSANFGLGFWRNAVCQA